MSSTWLGSSSPKISDSHRLSQNHRFSQILADACFLSQKPCRLQQTHRFLHSYTLTYSHFHTLWHSHTHTLSHTLSHQYTDHLHHRSVVSALTPPESLLFRDLKPALANQNPRNAHRCLPPEMTLWSLGVPAVYLGHDFRFRYYCTSGFSRRLSPSTSRCHSRWLWKCALLAAL